MGTIGAGLAVTDYENTRHVLISSGLYVFNFIDAAVSYV